MSKPLQISIPTPCHENWAEMTPADKGRFCASCQKNVIDFTKASDREIANIFRQQGNVCGRFRNDQLNRDLIIPKEKSSLWAAASAAIISFITLGSHEVLAQEPVNIVQSPILNEETVNKLTTPQTKIISGVVRDFEGVYGILPSASVCNKNTGDCAVGDEKGFFSIAASTNDTIEITYVGYHTATIVVGSENNYDILITPLEPYDSILMGAYERQRTFFGRMFHSIGNWFR